MKKVDQQKTPREHQNFEELLADLSAKLVNLPLKSIDEAIESSMKTLVEFFETGRCHIGTFSDDQTKIAVSFF